MQSEFYSYAEQMQRYLDAQDRRIAKLESDLTRLAKELDEIKKKPPINVERIEYKFDQLKVESLEGTLNIGLNPNDLANIDEFTVNKNPAAPAPYLFPERDIMTADISDAIKGSLPAIITENEERSGTAMDPSYHDFIRHDVERQLPARIDMYINETPQPERVPHLLQNVKEKVIERITSDIHAAIAAFMSQSNSQTGGNSDNGV
ncbi:spore germination protein GerPC [Bacillus sp. MUM 13]|uniref:spore germination protein GerPC n=1 Tax=Bacillus sp. MUM 13 TaxID=1678001 RepID=UPI0008F5F7A9|nr:spore germination protein GerPC [Bacillus sp. MUM 13]OIK14088.1 hypothetical protein BIV59_03860 [Bacillus sp. MUM 13]